MINIPEDDQIILTDITSRKMVKGIIDLAIKQNLVDIKPTTDALLDEWFSQMKTHYLKIARIDLTIKSDNIGYFEDYINLLSEVYEKVIIQEFYEYVRSKYTKKGLFTWITKN